MAFVEWGENSSFNFNFITEVANNSYYFIIKYFIGLNSEDIHYSIPGSQDHDLSQRQTIYWTTQAPLDFLIYSCSFCKFWPHYFFSFFFWHVSSNNLFDILSYILVSLVFTDEMFFDFYPDLYFLSSSYFWFQMNLSFCYWILF